MECLFLKSKDGRTVIRACGLAAGLLGLPLLALTADAQWRSKALGCVSRKTPRWTL